MHCALCDLENLPATNTGICPDCWNGLNTEDVKGKLEIKVEDGKKQVKIKREK
tara:strand:+ start:476 stop:634 length:159 start_codon:yes stop_codon:yes gene_type:complete